MNINFPDHPEVAMALRTGYPRRRGHEVCASCGGGADVYGDTEGLLCLFCALDTWGSLSNAEKLALMGFEKLE